MGQELDKINIKIAGRSYPMKVSAKEKHLVTSIEKEINDQIQTMQTRYDNMDIQDYLSMVLIQKAFESYSAVTEEMLDKATAIKNRLEGVNY